MIYLEIFFCYFQIGLFSVGGGHASIALVKSMVVDNRHWLTFTEFIDMITIAEMTPGPFALNSATFVGVKMGGLAGGALATFACMAPSFLIVLLLSFVYKKYRDITAVSGALKGIQPAVTALIAAAGVSLLCLALFDTNQITEIKSVDGIAVFLTAAAFALLRWKKINYVIMILCTGAVGALIYIIRGAFI
jgi:chromate transporter